MEKEILEFAPGLPDHFKINGLTTKYILRDLAKKYTVDVEIKLIFSDKSIKLPTGATVPDAFLKTIKYNGITEKYYFLNEKPKSSNFKLYLIK